MNNFLLIAEADPFPEIVPQPRVFNDCLQFNHPYIVPSRSIRTSSLLSLTLKLISVFALGALLVSACPLDSLSATVSCTVLGSEACCSYEVAFVLGAKASLSLSPLTYSMSLGVHTSGEGIYDQATFLLLPYPTPS